MYTCKPERPSTLNIGIDGVGYNKCVFTCVPERPSTLNIQKPTFSQCSPSVPLLNFSIQRSLNINCFHRGGGCFLQNPIWRARDDGGPETTRSAFCFPECCLPLRVKHLRAPRLCRWSYRFQRKKFRVLDDIQACTRTVRFRGMGTDISEASKRVPISSFATQGGKQVSSHFRQGNWDNSSSAHPIV